MCNVPNMGIVSMLLYFLLVHVLFFTDARQAHYYYRKVGSESEKATVAVSDSDTNGHNISSTLSAPGHVLVKSGYNKNVTKDKAVKNDAKGSKVSKDTKNQKSSNIKKLNVTKGELRSTKGNLRLGKPYKDVKWPNLQKHGLRDKGLGSARVTKMNMMQMGDSTPLPGSKALTEQNINEILSPYTIKEQMIRIGAKFDNVNVTVEVIGRTMEYNDIVIMKMTKMNIESGRFRADDNKYVDDTNEKKIIFIVHALSVMGMIALDCLIQEKHFVQLVSYYLQHLDKFDIFLIPMANPDGFVYPSPNWNKNNSPQDACSGVALDRNFDIGWNGSRVLSSCSQQYPGPAPFSEPETRAVRDVLHRYSHKIIAYIHVHGGMYSDDIFKGDAVLYPKGYTDIQSDDDKYIDLKGEIDEMIRKSNFQVYSVTVDTLHSWYGRVAGTSVDYASSVYGIPYAMEFVMQLYSDGSKYKMKSEERFSYNVMVEVWRRVIDVVANNIWNTLHSNEL